MPSLAFKTSKRGKLTFDRDSTTRDYKRDNRHFYAALRTVFMRKGGYYFDPTGTAGTNLYTVVTDQLTTGSRVVAFATDGMRQVEQARLVLSPEVQALRNRPGSWSLHLSWQTLDGETFATSMAVA